MGCAWEWWDWPRPTFSVFSEYVLRNSCCCRSKVSEIFFDNYRPLFLTFCNRVFCSSQPYEGNSIFLYTIFKDVRRDIGAPCVHAWPMYIMFDSIFCSTALVINVCSYLRWFKPTECCGILANLGIVFVWRWLDFYVNKYDVFAVGIAGLLTLSVVNPLIAMCGVIS